MPHRGTSNRLRPGAVVADRRLATIAGDEVAVPRPGALVHLQFRRFAGCPVCTLHLRSFVRRHAELVAADVREVVLFHSTAEDLRRHAGDLPFAVVADPDQRLYAEFRVESSHLALLDPRAWFPILRAVAHSLVDVARGRRPRPPLDPPGGRYGLPADFLIAGNGRVVACHYGAHVDDHWSLDRVLALAAEAGHRAPQAAPAARSDGGGS